MPFKKKVKRDPIPEEFPSLEAAAEFWDTHDATDYWDLTRPVKNFRCRIERERYLIELEPATARRLMKAARRRRVSSKTLANRWLSERLAKARVS